MVCCIFEAACATSGSGGVSDAPAVPKPASAKGAPQTPSPAQPQTPSPAQPQATYSADVEQRIERVIRGLLPATERSTRFGPPANLAHQMAYYHTPGVSIAVINEGKIEWARGFGLRDVKSKEPMTADTLMQAASISKPVTALAIMRLVEQGKVELDEDIHRYLKSWKVPPSGDWQAVITLRELLSHSAGLTVHGFLGYHVKDPIPTVHQILDGAAPANSPPIRVNILPETAFRYSGGGTTVVQVAMMDHLNRPFPEIMHELVLGPLKMAHSTFEQPLPATLHGTAATAHPWKGEPIEGRWHTYPELAAAGLWTTPTDLCAVGLELQRAVKGESKLLSKKLADEMLTRQMGDVGVGFFLQGKDATIRFGHTGGNMGFLSKATFYKNKGIGAVVMINSSEGHPILDEIERSIAREYQWPDYFKEEKKRVALEAAALDRFAGEYETEKGVRLVLARDGKDLVLTVGRQPSVRLAPYEASKFFASTLELEAIFTVSGNQPAERVTLQQERATVEAKRKTSAPIPKRR